VLAGGRPSVPSGHQLTSAFMLVFILSSTSNERCRYSLTLPMNAYKDYNDFGRRELFAGNMNCAGPACLDGLRLVCAVAEYATS